jgi:plastocyanin
MKRIAIWIGLLVLVFGACGGSADGNGASGGGEGEDRTVLVDYKHDQFASSFLHYYPETVKVRPGDTVTFRQSWTGEPHSVTMGKVVDELFEVAPLVQDYENEEAARAGGLDEAIIERAVAAFSKVPNMTDRGFEVYQPGAKPCFVEDVDDVPEFSDAGENPDPKATCPTLGERQPAFNGRQGLYNSGFIPYQGSRGNTFVLPIADDATPGTYQYFCNYHYVEMHGTVEVVAAGEAIPSAGEVRRQAQREIAQDASAAISQVKKAKRNVFDAVDPPLIGLDTGKEMDLVAIDEFYPSKVEARVGRPVTWTMQGFTHTISFNVPKYFPIFTVDDDDDVHWDPKSYEPVAWDVPPLDENASPEAPPAPRKIDVGRWDGGGGFHSSGFLVPGDTFTVTFTKPGTYSFACVLHPQMVGTLEVKA